MRCEIIKRPGSAGPLGDSRRRRPDLRAHRVPQGPISFHVLAIEGPSSASRSLSRAARAATIRVLPCGHASKSRAANVSLNKMPTCASKSPEPGGCATTPPHGRVKSYEDPRLVPAKRNGATCQRACCSTHACACVLGRCMAMPGSTGLLFARCLASMSLWQPAGAGDTNNTAAQRTDC